jgi:hypothetical protein
MHYFIERMMSKDKDLRYSTPRELVDDVNEQIEGFRSLEYRPDEEGGTDSNVMRLVNKSSTSPRPETRPQTRRIQTPPSTARRLQPPPPPGTRRIATLDDLKKRLRKK